MIKRHEPIADGTYRLNAALEVFDWSDWYQSGYWVGTEYLDGGPSVNLPLRAVDLERYGPGLVGVWADAGIVYIDRTVYVPTLDAALTLARQHGQIAIWDIAAREAVSVSYNTPPWAQYIPGSPSSLES